MSNPSQLEQLAGDTEFDIDKYQDGFYDIDKIQQQQSAKEFDVDSWESGKGGKPGPSRLEQLAATPPAPEMTAEGKASQTRQMAVGALTGMATPNMSPADVAQFQAGKAAGAVSVPLVAAGATAAITAPEVIAALKAAAKAHPIVAKVIVKGLEGMGLGAGIKAFKLLE